MCSALSDCSWGLTQEDIPSWSSHAHFRPLRCLPNAPDVSTQSGTECPWDLLSYSAFSTISKILWGRNALYETYHIALLKRPCLPLFVIASSKSKERAFLSLAWTSGVAAGPTASPEVA